MKSNPTPTPRWSTIAAMIVFWLTSALTLQAQSGSGTIQGRIYNPVSQEYVRNAEVRL